ncbi:MAG: C10 family peptidase [Prevotella sp.]|nr:C10 family peptidase [Prevotella sp.]
MNKISTLLSVIIIVIAACDSEKIKIETDITFPNPLPQKIHITIDEAEQRLNNIIIGLKKNNTRATKVHDFTITSRYNTTLNKTRSSRDSLPDVYIFNFGNKEGYAIMSDNIYEPDLYALSFDGELRPDSIIDEPFAKLFLAALKARSDSLPGLPIDGDDDLEKPINYYWYYTPWITTDKVYDDGTVELCKVKWGQNSPYNGMLGTYNGYHIPTGCTATAVGQLMSVYKHPNFYSPFYLDWDGIVSYQKMTYSTPYPYLYEVQSLMLYLGMYNNLDLEYDAENNQNLCHDINNITRTLSNFGYTSSGNIAGYQTSTIVRELLQGYPVLLLGKDASSSSSHIWLGHGLQTKSRKKILYDVNTHKPIRTINQVEYYIRCNFGYNGNVSDKLYLSGVFDTRTEAEIEMGTEYGNYQYDLRMITGIRK